MKYVVAVLVALGWVLPANAVEQSKTKSVLEGSHLTFEKRSNGKVRIYNEKGRPVGSIERVPGGSYRMFDNRSRPVGRTSERFYEAPLPGEDGIYD